LKHTVAELWNQFIDTSGKGEATLDAYRRAKERFFRFFKLNELVSALRKDRMEEWKAFLLDERYAEATVAGTISKAKAVFNWAKQQRWITVSPLAGVGAGSFRNEAKDRVITQEEYRKLLDACPDQEWRVIITLARIGGLHPCEIVTLRWQDIDKEQHRFHVRNAKLKRIERLYKRAVPLFEEVLTELEALRSIPGNEDQEYVINCCTDRENSRLQKPFARIAQKAGIGTIPRPFDNMRASRSTEIHREWGSKVESEWLGHSEKMAFDHYLMVTDDDYAVAAGEKKSA
jgi:integrase